MTARFVAIGVLVGLAVQTQVPASPAASEPTPYVDSDAYDVYSAALPLNWTWSATNATRLIIDKQTVSPAMCIVPDAKSASVLEPILAQYTALAKTPWVLQAQLTLSRPYELISHQELQAIINPPPGAWERFMQHYPASGHSYITFSPVAFNSDRTIAIVYMANFCGHTCGGGHFYVLQKRKGTWTNTAWSNLSCGWAS